MITCGTQVVSGSTGGGGASLPATPADALLDEAAPSTIVVLDADGHGEGLSPALLAPTLLTAALALRRPAGSSALLWECTESASPLASTGSVACSLANAGAATIGHTEPLSPLAGTCVRFTGASTSECVGGAGVYPSTATTTAATMWAWVVIRTMPTGFDAGAVVCRDYALTGGGWSDPYCAAVMLRAGGVVVGMGSFGASPAYDEIASAAGEVAINRLHLVGLTYSAGTLRVWVDGRQVASKSVAAPLAWGSAGSWHLGASGNGDRLDGQILRTGVETAAWTQTQWATLYRQTMGAAS